MAMTIKQIRDTVRDIIDIDSTDITDTVMNRIIGQGYDTIVYSEKRWPFYEIATTFSTVAGQSEYSLSTVGASVTIDSENVGVREIVALKNDDHIFRFIGRDDADFNYALNVNTSSDPWEWSFWNDTLKLYPTPNTAETIYVRGFRNAKAFGDGVSDTVEPDLPDPFHSVLTTYAIAKAYLQQEDPTMAAQYMQNFRVELDNVARRYADMPAPQPIVANSRKGTRYLAGFGALRYADTGGVIW